MYSNENVPVYKDVTQQLLSISTSSLLHVFIWVMPASYMAPMVISIVILFVCGMCWGISHHYAVTLQRLSPLAYALCSR